MSLITMTEFEEFVDEFPEMEQCYDFSREALDHTFYHTIDIDSYIEEVA